MTRAAYLALAAEEILPLLRRRSWPGLITITVGPMICVPESSVGEAWIEPTGVGRVNIHPCVVDSLEVLEILAHELLHLSVGPHRLHGMRYRRAARRAGFIRPPYDTAVAGYALSGRLLAIVDALGEYPE